MYQDTSLLETHKQQALYGYLGGQDLSTDADILGRAGHGGTFRDSGRKCTCQLSESASIEGDAGGDVGKVVKVYFRGDTAVNQKDLLRYCPEGKNDRFGVIKFAVGVDVTAEFKRAVSEVEEGEWQSLDREVDGQRVKTEQE